MRLSIGAKLAAAFGAVLAVTAILGLLGLAEIRTVTGHAMHINERDGAVASRTSTRRRGRSRSSARTSSATSPSTTRRRVDADLVADRKDAAAAFRAYRPLDRRRARPHATTTNVTGSGRPTAPRPPQLQALSSAGRDAEATALMDGTEQSLRQARAGPRLLEQRRPRRRPRRGQARAGGPRPRGPDHVDADRRRAADRRRGRHADHPRDPRQRARHRRPPRLAERERHHRPARRAGPLRRGRPHARRPRAVTPAIERFSGDELGDAARAVENVRGNTVASLDAYNSSRHELQRADRPGRRQRRRRSRAASEQMASTSDEAGRAVERDRHGDRRGRDRHDAPGHVDRGGPRDRRRGRGRHDALGPGRRGHRPRGAGDAAVAAAGAEAVQGADYAMVSRPRRVHAGRVGHRRSSRPSRRRSARSSTRSPRSPSRPTCWP